jgi:hypothetical protein
MHRSAAIALVLAALAMGSAGIPRLLAQEAKPAASSAEQLARCVRQLDADEFLTRETAMLELIAAGPAALPVIKPVLTSGSLETISRALFVVQQLGSSGNEIAQEQAWSLLVELAGHKESPVLARRAAAVLDQITQQRKVVALAELEALGVKIARSQFLGGLPLDEEVMSIEIGDGFQGQEADLRRLKWLQDVPVVIFSGQKVTDGWIGHTAAMPSLEELHLYQTRVSDASLLPLAGYQTLRQLGIYYTPVGDKILESLAKLPMLAFVKLYGTEVTKQGVENFKAASGMARLDCRRGAFLGVGCLSGVGHCLISTVHDGSPAEKGGIKQEDVIVRFGQVKVQGFDELTEEISKRDVGEEVELELARRAFDDQGNQAAKSVVTTVKLMPWELELAVRNGPRP